LACFDFGAGTRRPSLSYEFVQRTVGPVIRAVYRVEIRGSERVPRSGPLVVAANHESVLDPFVLGAAIPRPLHYVAKGELWRYPIVRALLDELGAIPVARGRGDVGMLRRARELLAGGEAVALFPEGGVRRRGLWLRGAARVALESGAPLLPVRLVGTAAALSPGRLGFPRLAVLIGEPLSADPGRATVAAAKALTRELQAAVAALAP
jgi:1-acyl-sn-glycerol-3-phosphate acyltransferase